ncbi:MAG TPA: AraC family transcriptional regulator [Umezawaea sp.]|nr:AraC family transcriptional regulator [Umezawaea sp.]
MATAQLNDPTPAGQGSARGPHLAAHWHFTDSGHFIRAFKKQYGQAPAEHARSHRAEAAS